jgi:catalase
LQFFNSQTEPEQNHIISAFIFELSKVETLPVRQRVVAQLANVDQTIADRVAAGLGMKSTPAAFPTSIPARTDLAASPALSILAKAEPILKGRKVGCLVADGTDLEVVKSLKSAAKRMGADFAVIAPKVGGAISADGKTIEGDFQLAGGPSVLFDTVFLALSEDGAKTLAKESAAVQWVSDAFAHLKVIGATAGAAPLLKRCGITPDAGVITDDADAYLKAAATGRIWDREPSVRTIY